MLKGLRELEITDQRKKINNSEKMKMKNMVLHRAPKKARRSIRGRCLFFYIPFDYGAL